MNGSENDIDRIIAHSAQISKLMLQQAKVSLEERTATIIQGQILSYLEKNNHAKMSDLASHIRTSFSSATQIVERMVQAGFVDRVQDANDRRLVLLTITENGRTQLKELKRAKRERMKKLFKDVTSNEIAELIRIQEKMIASLKENKER